MPIETTVKEGVMKVKGTSKLPNSPPIRASVSFRVVDIRSASTTRTGEHGNQLQLIVSTDQRNFAVPVDLSEYGTVVDQFTDAWCEALRPQSLAFQIAKIKEEGGTSGS